jgi:hypothetical protein
MAIINRGNKGMLGGTVVSVDPLTQTIQFAFSNEEGSALVTDSVSYEARAYDKEFFDKLGEAVKQQIEKTPAMDLQKVSLLLPDQLFLIDTITVPVIHRKAMQQSLSIAVEAVYKNAEELNLMTYSVQQNKQAVTFGLVGARNDVLTMARDTFDNAEAPVNAITFASNAMVDGAMALNAKLKSDTFLLLDIKKDCARFAFVVRGCTMGYYDLPFGYSVMHESHVVAEDTLYDHPAAELTVQDSIQKARAATDEARQPSGQEIAHDGKKRPRFMQRPTPQSREEYIYENFRVFLKWTLELINNNRDITSLAKIDTVYINMPDQYRFLFDVVNRKHEGRGLTFAPLLSEDGQGSFAENLELYGGFFLDRYNQANTF